MSRAGFGGGAVLCRFGLPGEDGGWPCCAAVSARPRFRRSPPAVGSQPRCWARPCALRPRGTPAVASGGNFFSPLPGPGRRLEGRLGGFVLVLPFLRSPGLRGRGDRDSPSHRRPPASLPPRHPAYAPRWAGHWPPVLRTPGKRILGRCPCCGLHCVQNKPIQWEPRTV